MYLHPADPLYKATEKWKIGNIACSIDSITSLQLYGSMKLGSSQHLMASPCHGLPNTSALSVMKNFSTMNHNNKYKAPSTWNLE